MPDLVTFLPISALAFPLTCLISWLCERFWSHRYKTAVLLRQLARKDRAEAAALRAELAPILDHPSHVAYGDRVHQHLTRLKAERDEARKDADGCMGAYMSACDDRRKLSAERDDARAEVEKWKQDAFDRTADVHNAMDERDKARQDAKEVPVPGREDSQAGRAQDGAAMSLDAIYGDREFWLIQFLEYCSKFLGMRRGAATTAALDRARAFQRITPDKLKHFVDTPAAVAAVHFPPPVTRKIVKAAEQRESPLCRASVAKVAYSLGHRSTDPRGRPSGVDLRMQRDHLRNWIFHLYSTFDDLPSTPSHVREALGTQTSSEAG